MVLIPFAINEVEAQRTLVINLTASHDGTMFDSDNNDLCSTTINNITPDNSSLFLVAGTLDITGVNDCERAWIEWDTSFANSGLSDDDVILNVTLFSEEAFTGFGARDCDVNHMGIQPSIFEQLNNQSTLDVWNDMRNGTTYINDDVWCAAVGELKKVLGATAATDLENNLSFDWFAIGLSDGTEIPESGASHIFVWSSIEDAFGDPINPTLQIWYNTTHYVENVADDFGLDEIFTLPTFARTVNITSITGDTFGNPPVFHSRTAPYNVWDDGNNELCDNTQQPFGFTHLTFGWAKNSSSSDCFKAVILWDIEAIPNNAAILNVSMILKGESVQEGIQLTENKCMFRHIVNYPPHTNDQGKGVDANDGEIYLEDPECSEKLGLMLQFPSVDTPEPPVLFNLGNATGEVQARLGDSGAEDNFDWFAVGLAFDDTIRNGTNDERQIVSGLTNPILQVRFSTPTDQITDLTAIGRFVDVDLDWTAPQTYGYNNVTGYQINFTSPQGNPVLTIIINDTGSTTSDALISGLNSAQNYTFRIQAWSTEPLLAELSNEVNVTTQSLGNFTIGTVGDTPQFTLNDTQADARDIKYVRTDVSDTQTVIDVIHPNSFTLQCDMYFKLALANQTFTGLTTVPEGATEKKATFTFNNQQNDIIEITCFDTATNVSADYLITQTNFLLLDQFKMFRDGTYGTQGQFGSIDLITLGAVIVAMIGFNRINETVGAIFLVIILGMLSFFEIVVWQTFMFGTVAAVIMLVVASTRKR